MKQNPAYSDEQSLFPYPLLDSYFNGIAELNASNNFEIAETKHKLNE